MNSKKIILASNNPGKIQEFQQLFTNYNIQILSQATFAITEVAETGLSFVENAIIKARHACLHSQLPAIADDSGLEVDALNGEPGIYSARYAGKKADSAAAINKLLQALSQIPDKERKARFQCVLVYMRHANDPSPIISQGAWEGFIAKVPQGNQGFGYDPIFYLPTLKRTAAELTLLEKNQLSHRSKALRTLISKLNEDGII